jgi:hypothetical protein
LGIDIKIIDASNTLELVGQLLDENRGGFVVVAGHSNTLPEIITGLGASPIEPIDDSDYDNIFVVSVSAHGATVTRIRQ